MFRVARNRTIHCRSNKDLLEIDLRQCEHTPTRLRTASSRDAGRIRGRCLLLIAESARARRVVPESASGVLVTKFQGWFPRAVRGDGCSVNVLLS